MNLRPFFGFYGGKWRDAPRLYPPPAHETIVEPFAGSAGYALRYPERRVLLCDLDPIVAGVWRYLLRVTPAEILAISDVALDGSVDDLRLPEEARWLVGFWLHRGVRRPGRRPSAWMRSGIRPGSFWGSRVRETIARQLPAIQHWRVQHGSYRNLRIDGAATWFIDPPYVGAGRYYRCGSDGIDYADLGAWCRARTGQVIVCEGPGATWLPFSPLGSTKTTRTGRRSVEAAWVRATEAA